MVTFHYSNGQDSLAIESKDKVGQIIKEKFDFIDNLDFFRHVGDSKSKSLSDCNLEDYTGRIIRFIYIDVIDPLGHINVDDVNRQKLFEIANKLHQSTPKRMVKQQLLFKSGDKFNKKNIEATQQLLFENPIFRNAQIVITEDEKDSEVIDVHVMVQDLWSWSLIGEVSHRYVGSGIAFDKFAGQPHRFSTALRINFDKRNIVTPTLKYDYTNIKGSFVNAGAQISHDWRTYKYEVHTNREFVSSKPQWAGAIKIGWYRSFYHKYLDQSYSNEQDFWLAKSFPFKINKKENLNIIVGSRIQRERYTQTPYRETQAVNDNKFLNTNSYLFGIGLANRNSVREKNIFDFYPYRNLPTGFNAHLIGGVIYKSDLEPRVYMGASFNHSKMKKLGYFQEEVALGNFINNGVEQITLQIKSKYFTHRIPLKKWGFRQYIYQNFTMGFLRPEGQDVNLNTNIKGSRQKYNGNSYYSVNLETEIHSPIKFIGFQARVFVFADLGLQGNKSDVPLGESRLYHAYGIGTRINNWKLGIGYIEFSLVYYPNTIGLENRSFEILQDFNNRLEIKPVNLYDKGHLSVVN